MLSNMSQLTLKQKETRPPSLFFFFYHLYAFYSYSIAASNVAKCTSLVECCLRRHEDRQKVNDCFFLPNSHQPSLHLLTNSTQMLTNTLVTFSMAPLFPIQHFLAFCPSWSLCCLLMFPAHHKMCFMSVKGRIPAIWTETSIHFKSKDL